MMISDETEWVLEYDLCQETCGIDRFYVILYVQVKQCGCGMKILHRHSRCNLRAFVHILAILPSSISLISSICSYGNSLVTTFLV